MPVITIEFFVVLTISLSLLYGWSTQWLVGSQVQIEAGRKVSLHKDLNNSLLFLTNIWLKKVTRRHLIKSFTHISFICRPILFACNYILVYCRAHSSYIVFLIRDQNGVQFNNRPVKPSNTNENIDNYIHITNTIEQPTYKAIKLNKLITITLLHFLMNINNFYSLKINVTVVF